MNIFYPKPKYHPTCKWSEKAECEEGGRKHLNKGQQPWASLTSLKPASGNQDADNSAVRRRATHLRSDPGFLFLLRVQDRKQTKWELKGPLWKRAEVGENRTGLKLRIQQGL